MLPGRERERLERWNELMEKRRFLRSSFEGSESDGRVKGIVAVRDVLRTNSGSSDTSREEGGMESDREWGACITTTISMWTRVCSWRLDTPF
jgi:hypothetical protein